LANFFRIFLFQLPLEGQPCRVLRNRGSETMESQPQQTNLFMMAKKMKTFRLAVGGVEMEIITRRLSVLICGKCFASLRIFQLSSYGLGINCGLIGNGNTGKE